MEGIVTSQLDTIIPGDLNLHLDDHKDTTAARFMNILHTDGMTQLVSEPTHIKVHTLDAVITKDSCHCVQDLSVAAPVLCDRNGNLVGDHFAVTFATTMG